MGMQQQEPLALENLPRLYNLIDPSGVLGYFDEDKAFIVDTELSWKFADLVASSSKPTGGIRISRACGSP